MVMRHFNKTFKKTFYETFWWYPLMRFFDEIFWWNILMGHFDETFWWDILMKPFYETFWWDILMRPFDETFWWDILMRNCTTGLSNLSQRVRYWLPWPSFCLFLVFLIAVIFFGILTPPVFSPFLFVFFVCSTSQCPISPLGRLPCEVLTHRLGNTISWSWSQNVLMQAKL